MIYQGIPSPKAKTHSFVNSNCSSKKVSSKPRWNIDTGSKKISIAIKKSGINFELFLDKIIYFFCRKRRWVHLKDDKILVNINSLIKRTPLTRKMIHEVPSLVQNVLKKPEFFSWNTRQQNLFIELHSNKTLSQKAQHLIPENINEASEFYLFLQNCLNEKGFSHLKPLLSALIQQTKDALLRKISTSSISLPLQKKEIDRTDPRRNPLILKKFQPTFYPSQNPLRVLHVSWEFIKAKVGGVGSVTESLLKKGITKDLDSRVVTPYYDFYFFDETYSQAKFTGFLEHEVEGKKVKSSIYKIWAEDYIPHYLVKPDPSYSALFDIHEAKLIYNDLPHSSFLNREIYFTSASAAFASFYSGKKQAKHFDIFNIQSWNCSLSVRLIKDKYNLERIKNRQPEIKTVMHQHHGTYDVFDKRSSSTWEKMGIPNSPKKSFSIYHETWSKIDGVVGVSQFISKAALDKACHLRVLAEKLDKNNALVGILNGLDRKDFDVTNPNKFFEFAIKNNAFIEGKAKAKQALFKAGLIPSSEKPLFIFIGRLVEEKGINTLPFLIEQIIKEKGQCLIMGATLGNYEPNVIKKLKKLEKKYPSYLRIETTIAFQQKKINQSQITQGNLVRLASDFTLIPSHVEACCLVALEALCSANFLITSNEGGLQDITNSTNSFNWNNKASERNKSCKQAITLAMSSYRQMQLLGTLNSKYASINAASEIYDWSAPNGSMEKLIHFYRHIVKSKVHDPFINDSVTLDGMKVMPPLLAGTIYQMLYHLDKIGQEEKICYWLAFGTLLGAERHHGLIPHDDDGDICVPVEDVYKLKSESFKQKLAKVGLQIAPFWFGFKIFPIKDHPLGKSHQTEHYQYKAPAIDIFLVKKKPEKIEPSFILSEPKAREIWKIEFKFSDVYNLVGKVKRVPFGPVFLNGVWNGTEVLKQVYGKNCLNETYLQYDHIEEKPLKSSLVKLTDFRSPAWTQWGGIASIPAEDVLS